MDGAGTVVVPPTDAEQRTADLLAAPKTLFLLANLGTREGVPWRVGLPTAFTHEWSRLDHVSENDLALLTLVFRQIRDWQWGMSNESFVAELAGRAEELRPVAERLVGTPAAQWWWQGLERDRQSHIGLPTQALSEQDFLLVPDEFSRNTTQPKRFLDTSTEVGGLPGTWLFYGADGLSLPPLAVWSVRASPEARVYEIHRPADWIALVDRYPKDTTEYYATSWRRNWRFPGGRVLTPDWALVAKDWDGVHLSMAGLLTATSQPFPLRSAWTMCEGWETEETVWLRWRFAKVERKADWIGPMPFDGDFTR
jgi:hypothetical protein